MYALLFIFNQVAIALFFMLIKVERKLSEFKIQPRVHVRPEHRFLIANSCGDDFLKEDAGHMISDGLLSTPEGVEKMVGSLYAGKREQRDFSWTLDNMILYNRQFGKHKVGATLLQSASAWNIETTSISANALEKDSYLWNAFGTVDKTSSAQGLSVETGLTVIN